jgi:hypothetical protein
MFRQEFVIHLPSQSELVLTFSLGVESKVNSIEIQ